MFKSLSTGAVGINVGFEESLRLAADNRFEGVHLDINEVARIGVSQAKHMLRRMGLKPSAWGFTVDVQHEQSAYKKGLADLAAVVAAAVELGCLRTSTWIYPFSDERPFQENFDFYVQRLGPAARILAREGIRLGLEFVGPKTSRAGHKHEFVHTLEGMLKLCSAVGPNVGLLLDSWHWYTTSGTVAALRQLTDAHIVDVHVNDAPAGIPVDEQVDGVRCMPGETGVIDIAGFLGALHAIGYTGPVMVEPFSDAVRVLPPAQAARFTADSLDNVWRSAAT